MFRLQFGLSSNCWMAAQRRNTRTMATALDVKTITSKVEWNEAKIRDNPFTEAWESATPYSSIPGPTRWELLKLFLPGGEFYNTSASTLQKYWRENYGNLVKIPGILGIRDKLMSFDPKIYEIVYRTEGLWPVRRGLETFDYCHRHVRPDVFGGIGGLMFEQGEKWARMRQTVGGVMLTPKAVKSCVPMVDQVTREFVAKMHTMRDKNGDLPVDFANEMRLWAIESIGGIALDRRLGVLESDRNEEADLLIKAIKDFTDLAYGFERRLSLWRFYKTKKFHSLISAFNTITNFVTKYVSDAVKAMEKLDADGAKLNSAIEESLLQQLLRIDRNYASLMVFDMIVAGIDTTAASAENLFYHLAINPEKQAKLTEEIMQLLPQIDSPITEETLSNAPYFRACLKESMRVQQLVSGQLRVTGQDVILNGFRVAKLIDVAMTMMSKEESYFTEGMNFLPERWLSDSAEAVASAAQTSSFAFRPFGFGPRASIGKRFAEMEMQILTFRILREYRIEWHHGAMQYSQTFITTPSNPLCYRLLRHDAN